ncbi:hypothetical protein FNL56_16675 [Tardiphaga sp. vice304]|uniref:hypothetical protein n=1 Tax=Tardiphaga sp. vice304 TaxID=2592817 RepID=UPI001162D2AE|nr:hypothetical protein [Tardiphaga sp. vice304]QDM27574.1 hypothetical protein FNL56_16675 [Tardiphaga sp. vice304]
MRDNLHNNAFRVAISPPAAAVADNTAIVGNWIDRLGFEALTFGILTGTLVDVDATFGVLIEDANATDQSDAAAVSDIDLISQTDGVAPEVAAGFSFAADVATRKIGYIGVKRFARITVTPAGNTGAAPIAAVAVLSHASQRPVV